MLFCLHSRSLLQVFCYSLTVFEYIFGKCIIRHGRWREYEMIVSPFWRGDLGGRGDQWVVQTADSDGSNGRNVVLDWRR